MSVFGVVKPLDGKTSFSTSTLRSNLKNSACMVCKSGFADASWKYVWQCDNSMCKAKCHSECMFDRVRDNRNLTCPGERCGVPITIADRDRIIYDRADALVEQKKRDDAEKAELVAERNQCIADNTQLKERLDMAIERIDRMEREIEELKKENVELKQKLADKDKLIYDLGLLDVARLKQDFEDIKNSYDESRRVSEAQIRLLIERLDSRS